MTDTATSQSISWSPYQQDIFDDVRSGTGHTVVQAAAGSAKTTTTVKSLEYVRPGERTILMAFNKIIAESLKSRVSGRAEVSTFHSFGLKTISKHLGRLPLETDKTYIELRKIYANATTFPRMHAKAVAKLVSLAKSTLVETPEDLDQLIEDYGIADDKGLVRSDMLHDAEIVLTRASTNPQMIDFDDMIWLPWSMELKPPTYSRVFIDETQDLNNAQIELGLSACSVVDEGRIMAVGDRRQAIYSFRGAAAGSMDALVSRLQAKEMPLNICYRCPRAVVELARQTVPTFEPWERAADGTVENRTKGQMLAGARPGDFVISRINGPLVGYCLALIREGRRAIVRGRDMGDNLQGLIRKSNASTIQQLVTWMDAWKVSELERLNAKDPVPETAVQGVLDKHETILALTEGAPTVDSVTDRILKLFSDVNDQNAVIFTTAHKAKGLESRCVWVLKDTFRQGQGMIDEDNVWYVAITRSMSELYLTSSH